MATPAASVSDERDVLTSPLFLFGFTSGCDLQGSTARVQNKGVSRQTAQVKAI